MLGITQAKLKLPIDFIQNLYNDFSQKVADKILLGMTEDRYTTLRVNTIKYDINSLKTEFNKLGIDYEEVDFYKDAFIIKNKTEKDIKELEIYKNGCIYMQSLSSMIPALILNPKPNEKVFDLTAAPGSKTTQIAALMENKGYILANEIDKIRCDRLKFNVKMQGAKIVEVINEDGRNVGNKYIEQFDKVLLDTPCSGEGRFLVNNSKTYNSWSKNLVEELSKLQKELFENAYKSLKNGGYMVYSTCTLNKLENEEIIQWALKNFNLKVLGIDLKLKKFVKASNKGYSKDIEKAIKIIPQKSLEGFFICLLKKE